MLLIKVGHSTKSAVGPPSSFVVPASKKRDHLVSEYGKWVWLSMESRGSAGLGESARKGFSRTCVSTWSVTM